MSLQTPVLIGMDARLPAALVIALVFAGCMSGGASPTASPDPTTFAPSLSVAPSETPRETLPIASLAACSAFDLARESRASVLVHLASNPDGYQPAGLSGNAVLGGTPIEVGEWHQPSPRDVVVVPRGELLFVDSFFDEGVPLCMTSVVVDAAPFSPIAAAPEASALARLAASTTSETRIAEFHFAAPSEPGEWIIRVLLSFATEPGPSHQADFFRLRVDVPAPTVAGNASAPVPCGSPGAEPPTAYISIDEALPVMGDAGGFTWGPDAGDGPAPLGPRVDVGTVSRIVITTEDDLCAGWWRIELIPRPEADWASYEPMSDLVPEHMGYAVRPGTANRFELAPVPLGDWIIGAFLEFADEQGKLIGQTTHFWNLVVR